MIVVTLFGCFLTFLAWQCCQKQLRTETLVKNCLILILKSIQIRVNNWVYVTYVRTPTFTNICTILDMHTLTSMLIFFPMIFNGF